MCLMLKLRVRLALLEHIYAEIHFALGHMHICYDNNETNDELQAKK